jgi:hypothetical protein
MNVGVMKDYILRDLRVGHVPIRGLRNYGSGHLGRTEADVDMGATLEGSSG